MLSALCYQTNVLFKNPKDFVIPRFPEQFEVVDIIRGDVGSGSEVFAFILQSNTKIIVVFRGTDTLEDALKDLDITLVPYRLIPNGGRVHRGFYSIYIAKVRDTGQSLRDAVFNTIQQLSRDKQLYITGSSLGGALTVLSAVDLANWSKFHDPIVYTGGIHV